VQKPTGKPVLVWDLPTRLFHWLLVLLLVLSFVTGKLGGSWLKWHFWSGYSVLALLLFRIGWGLVGSTTARFSHFVKGPAAGLVYLRGLFRPVTAVEVGHNPVGGWMVIVLIIAVLAQATTGLFTSDDIDTFGPLAEKVSSALSSKLSSFHRLWINVILVLAGLHVCASLFYYVVKRQNLVLPMITGRKHLPDGQMASQIIIASSGLAVVILAIAAAIVFGVLRFFG